MMDEESTGFDEPFDLAQDRQLGLPRGSVRSLLSLGVVVGAFAIAAYLLLEHTSSDLTKVVVGGWIAALGNVRNRACRRLASESAAEPYRRKPQRDAEESAT